MSVLVILEQSAGKWSRLSFEAVSAARRIADITGGPLCACTLGSNPPALSVDKQIALDHPLLARYTSDGFTAALEQLVRSLSPSVVVFPHSYQTRDYAPKLATRFGCAFVSDVVDVKNEGGLLFVRQLFQGKLHADVRATGDLVFASVQAGAFPAADPASSAIPVESFSVELDPSKIRSQPEEPFREAQRSVDLGAAEWIVAVGRGIKEKDNLAIVEELAQVLGAELAASRPICDNGWLPMERQVGSSGQTVAPKVYVAIGISGAIQHLVGMKGSKLVVAINKDENAPIFESAHYGIVGDLFEVVPALVAAVREAKA